MTPPRPRPVAFAATACLAAIVLLASCGSSGGPASATTSPTLEVLDARIDKPSLPSETAVRMVIHNGTARADRLIRVRANIAPRATVHRSTTDSAGRDVMLPVSSVPIPARSDVTFQPGGLHVMLTGITRKLSLGEEVTLEITFARGGTLTVSAPVVSPGTDPMDMEQDHDG